MPVERLPFQLCRTGSCSRGQSLDTIVLHVVRRRDLSLLLIRNLALTENSLYDIK